MTGRQESEGRKWKPPESTRSYGVESAGNEGKEKKRGTTPHFVGTSWELCRGQLL